MKRFIIVAFVCATLIYVVYDFVQPAEVANKELDIELISEFQDDEICESSGLIPSKSFPGKFWTHNDSGNRAELFLVDLEGRLIKKFSVPDANAIDWEEIAIDTQGNIYVADIGDNFYVRGIEVNLPQIYIIPEPTSLEGRDTLDVTECVDVDYNFFRFNAEAMCISPTGEMMILTKSPEPSKIYVYENKQWVFKQNIKIKGLVTAADMNEKGVLAVLTYKGVGLFVQNEQGKWVKNNFKKFPKNSLEQCEAICWYGEDLIVTNEQKSIYRIRMALK